MDIGRFNNRNVIFERRDSEQRERYSYIQNKNEYDIDSFFYK